MDREPREPNPFLFLLFFAMIIVVPFGAGLGLASVFPL